MAERRHCTPRVEGKGPKSCSVVPGEALQLHLQVGSEATRRLLALELGPGDERGLVCRTRHSPHRKTRRNQRPGKRLHTDAHQRAGWFSPGVNKHEPPGPRARVQAFSFISAMSHIPNSGGKARGAGRARGKQTRGGGKPGRRQAGGQAGRGGGRQAGEQAGRGAGRPGGRQAGEGEAGRGAGRPGSRTWWTPGPHGSSVAGAARTQPCRARTSGHKKPGLGTRR